MQDELNYLMKMFKEVIEDFTEKATAPHALSLYQVITVMSDGKERTWSELQNEIKLSPRTLTSVLKKLVKDGYVERRIIPAFPPKSVYALKNDYLRASGSFLKKFSETQTLNLVKAACLYKSMPAPEYTPLFLSSLYLNLLELLETALNFAWPPKKEEPATSYVLLCCIIGATQSFIASLLALSKGGEEKPRDIINEIKILIEERRKELEHKMQVKISAEP